MFFEVLGVDGSVGSYIVGKVVISSEVGIEAREELLEASFNRLALCFTMSPTIVLRRDRLVCSLVCSSKVPHFTVYIDLLVIKSVPQKTINLGDVISGVDSKTINVDQTNPFLIDL